MNSLGEHADQTAVYFNDTTLSYHKLDESIRRLAAGMQGLGVKKGDRVALMLPNVPHFIISYYAALYLGAVVVPINFLNSSEEIYRQVAETQSTLFITWQGFNKIVSQIASLSTCNNIIVLGERIPQQAQSLTHLISRSAPLHEPTALTDDDLAVINYTSGIAHQALGVELTHGALAASADICQDTYRMQSSDRILAVLPLFHTLSQTFLLHTTLTCGATIILFPRFDPQILVHDARKYKGTFLVAVPDMYKSLVDESELDPYLPSLRFCMSYGGHLPEELMHDFENRFDTMVLKSYGLTEAGSLVASTRTDRERRPNSVGLPLMGVEVQIRDGRGNILHPNTHGEIFVKSLSLMRGYHQNTEETKKRIFNNWLSTGDIGYVDLDHYLYIVERVDNIIVKGGFEIYPKEIESLIMELEVQEVAVIGVPDHVQGHEVKAYIVKKPESNLTAEHIAEYCNNSLPVYKCPKFIEFVDSIPKSPTGRVLKRLLPKKKTATSE